MDKFLGTSKMSFIQTMINNLNDNIDYLNKIIADFTSYIYSLDLKTDDIDLEYIEITKVKLTEYSFTISDRIFTLKSSEFIPLITINEDKSVNINTPLNVKQLDELLESLKLDINRFEKLISTIEKNKEE